MNLGLVTRFFGRRATPKAGDRIWWADKAVAGAITAVKNGVIRFVAGPSSAPRQFQTAANAADAVWRDEAMAWVLGVGTAVPPAAWGGWSSTAAVSRLHKEQ